MITCTKCSKRKEENLFRTRTKRGYVYKQHTCKACEAKAQRDRVNKVKHTEEYKQKNKANAKQYIEKNKEKIREKRKITHRASNPHYRNLRKLYWANNEEQRIKHKKHARKYQEKIVSELTDNYVLQHIIQRTNLKKEDIPKELIEAKRVQMQLKRVIIKTQNKDGN